MITLQRCAACGSPNVKLDYRKEGFNVGKGVAGAVLVGPAGALLGTDGNKTYIYQCPDCGLVLSYCMKSGEALEISKAIYEYEQSGKIHFMLPEYKRRYKNIEWENPSVQPKIETNPEIISARIDEEILGYLNKIGTLSEYDTIVSQTKEKLGLEFAFEVEQRIKALMRTGRVDLEKMDGAVFVRLITDIDEIREVSQKHNAKYKADEYITEKGVEFEQLLAEKLGDNKTYSIEIIEATIKELFLTYIDEENPYCVDEFVSRLISRLRRRFILIRKDDLFTILGLEEAELLRKEKARKEEEERLEKKKPKEQPFIDFLSNHPDETFTISEMLEEGKLLEVFKEKNIEMYNQRAAATLNVLVEEGKLEKTIKRKKIYYGVPGIEDRKKYKLACEYLEKCNTQIEYIEAAEKFAELNDYEDSAEKSEYCLKLAVEVAVKEEEEARRNAEKAKIEAEEEAKRNAEKAKIEAEKNAIKKKKMKKMLVLLGIIIVVALVGMSISKNSKEKELASIRSTLPQSISAGAYHTVGLKSDGTVVATGDNDVDQCDVDSLKDIVAVYAGVYHTVGLKSDGTVVAAGYNEYGQCDVENWRNIETVSAGFSHTVGLKSDGTVVAIGDNLHGESDVKDWRDIVAVSAGNNHTVGVKSDGTVVATGLNEYGQCDVDSWRDIVAVSTRGSYTVGVKSDGTVVATGLNEYGQCDVEDWEDIVAVSAGYSYTVGVKSDGTVVATGENYDGQCDVDGWNDIIAISSTGDHTVGLKSDGTVVATGDNDDGQCFVKNWKNIATTNLK